MMNIEDQNQNEDWLDIKRMAAQVKIEAREAALEEGAVKTPDIGGLITEEPKHAYKERTDLNILPKQQDIFHSLEEDPPEKRYNFQVNFIQEAMDGLFKVPFPKYASADDINDLALQLYPVYSGLVDAQEAHIAHRMKVEVDCGNLACRCLGMSKLAMAKELSKRFQFHMKQRKQAQKEMVEAMSHLITGEIEKVRLVISERFHFDQSACVNS